MASWGGRGDALRAGLTALWCVTSASIVVLTTPTLSTTDLPDNPQEGLKPVFDEAIRCVLEHQNKPQKKKNKCVVC